MSGGVELVRIDFWNSSTKAYYGYATFTANDTNPTTKIDAYCKLGDETANTTQTVNYTPGAINTFETGFGGDTSSVRTTLPTETVNGSINVTINCTAFYLDDVMFAIKQFVRNPSAGDYDFTTDDGKKATVTITAPEAYPAVFKDGVWYVDTQGDRIANLVFTYGATDNTPLVGDINQDGKDDIAVVSGKTWWVDTTGDHVADYGFDFGAVGDIPLVGDLNHDRIDDIAVVSGNVWWVDTTGDHLANLGFLYGVASDTPLVWGIVYA